MDSVQRGPRGALAREQLQCLVDDGLTLAQIAEKVDRHVSTVRYWLAKYELKTIRRRRNHDAFCQADAHGLKRTEADCLRHGMTEFVRRPDGGWRCVRCRSEAVVEWRRRLKRRLVDEAGGCCILCGYERHIGALEFHHLDPSQKEFLISRNGITRALAEVRREAAKCVLLCANCHAEVEGGVATVPARVLGA